MCTCLHEVIISRFLAKSIKNGSKTIDNYCIPMLEKLFVAEKEVEEAKSCILTSPLSRFLTGKNTLFSKSAQKMV